MCVCVGVWVAGRVAITFVSFRTEIYLHGPLYAATAEASSGGNAAAAVAAVAAATSAGN